MNVVNILREFGPSTAIIAVLGYALFLIAKYYTKDNKEERAYNRTKDEKLVTALRDINASLTRHVAATERTEATMATLQDDMAITKEKTLRVEQDIKALREDVIILKERVTVK